MKLSHPIDGQRRLFGVAVDFGAIAGGQDRRFLDRAARRQIMQRRLQALSRKRHLLADGERRGLVVDAKGEKQHKNEGLGEKGIILQGFKEAV